MALDSANAMRKGCGLAALCAMPCCAAIAAAAAAAPEEGDDVDADVDTDAPVRDWRPWPWYDDTNGAAGDCAAECATESEKSAVA